MIKRVMTTWYILLHHVQSYLLCFAASVMLCPSCSSVAATRAFALEGSEAPCYQRFRSQCANKSCGLVFRVLFTRSGFHVAFQRKQAWMRAALVYSPRLPRAVRRLFPKYSLAFWEHSPRRTTQSVSQEASESKTLVDKPRYRASPATPFPWRVICRAHLIYRKQGHIDTWHSHFRCIE